ncbi:MAG: L,D-transpeptidase family protein [Deltaproteobacteria bacterium]|nr:L,D-transpeptidase family protein [Deltaproteobacteria bacterium]
MQYSHNRLGNLQHFLAALVALAGLAGCEGQDQPKKPTEAAAPQAESAPAPVAAPAPKLADIVQKIAIAAKKAADDEAATVAKQQKAAGADKKLLELVAPSGTLRFYSRDGTLSKDGADVLALLAELDRHGLDKSGYRLGQIDQATAAVPQAFAEERKILLTLEKQPRAALVAAAAALWLRGGDGSAVALSRAGAEQLGENGLRALDAAVPALAVAAQKSREALIAADQELLRAAARYVVDFDYANPAHPLKYTPPAEVRKMTEKNAEAIAKVFKDNQGKLGDGLKKHWPNHPQYVLLQGAYDTYKKLVEAGGWPALPKLTAKQVKKGEIGPYIVALRQRLQAEGYEVGSGDRFDDDLEAAVKAFQGRHQLDPDGIVTATVHKELEVTAEKRLRLIQLAMQRYRESEGKMAGDDDFFLFVNIAFQMLWVYDHGAIVDKHKVIVGNNDTDSDQVSAVKGKINRTKMFSHKMVRVILAPKWFPTSRVVELELQPKLAKDPSFLEKEGYVREVQPDGTEKWYQKAGKSNLLGDVKFQGPNAFNIYLHDTPFREKFSFARRPFSHGCVRVHKPVDLAELILGRDKGMSAREIRDIIQEKEEKEIKLKTPLSVHIDYASAGVDEEGNVIFGADIYGYDQAFFDGVLPVEEAKEYKAGSTRGL